MAKCKYYNFEDHVRMENQLGLEGKVATHHMKLLHLVACMQHPLVVEFGVGKGRSTCLLLTACEKTGGHLFSVDIRDCSDVAVSECWTFIQANDQDIDTILQAAPDIAQGIDLLHIDSVHTGDHVANLLMKWFTYVKSNGYITFHDVDETPYKLGRRKENRENERKIIGHATAIKEFFYANEDQLFLEFHFGSTGMGIMKKLSPMGTSPQPPVPLRSKPISITESLKRVWKAFRSRVLSSFSC